MKTTIQAFAATLMVLGSGIAGAQTAPPPPPPPPPPWLQGYQTIPQPSWSSMYPYQYPYTAMSRIPPSVAAVAGTAAGMASNIWPPQCMDEGEGYSDGAAKEMLGVPKVCSCENWWWCKWVDIPLGVHEGGPPAPVAASDSADPTQSE